MRFDVQVFEIHSARIVILSFVSCRIGCLMLPELSIVGDSFVNFAKQIIQRNNVEYMLRRICRLDGCLKVHSARNSAGNVAYRTRAMENFDNSKKKELFTPTNHSPPIIAVEIKDNDSPWTMRETNIDHYLCLCMGVVIFEN
ncbi:2,5-diamino-6-ribosylamino-4(3H)-pyrimidinone 5'-phosphate reductase [Trichinella spiralis]|uniref:2,5-diamino-6-ribosylamino-4(3H)-pyrimidinone 5'-phosphate reductase n=1 Tax=Trichinella spiralis TaxID=6334 RepID=A0ABR3KBR7_TRISP